MNIITTSIHIIDYENQKVFTRETPKTFNEYVYELIEHINGNSTVREFKTRSAYTEVISCAKQICENQKNATLVEEKTNAIANRLLSKEIYAQGLVGKMNTNVQKGSLIQALIYNEETEWFTYLLAKVEHSDFVDDSDFTFKTGFSKDKKTIWKSCLIDLPTLDADEYFAKIYSNNIAKYWSSDFLELDETMSDENNTLTAFKAIECVLTRNLKNTAPRDYTIIRNSIISYFKNNEHFDYTQMIDSVLGKYQATDLAEEKIISLKGKLNELPKEKKFDRQFSTVASVINARIKKVYNVNDGIQIKITDEIPDIENIITSCRDTDGTKYIKIRTNNEQTFKQFLSK